MTCRANKALPPCSPVSPPDSPNPPTSRLCIEGERCLHESLPSLSLNPLGQKKSGRLVASGQTQMGLSRLVVTLPFCCQDCAQGAHECHGWVRRWEATQSSTRSSQHTFCWGCLHVLFLNAADDHLHQRAGRENFFFFLCMIGCFSVPAPGQFNLIGEKRKKKKSDPFMALLLVSKQKALIKSEK